MPGDIDVATLSHAFGPAEIGVIKELMAKIRAAGTPLYDVKPEQFRHPLLDTFMLPLVDELKQGPGLVLITGFDELGDDIDDWRLAYWGIGTYFGNQVSQSVRGDLMGDVKVKPNSIGGRLYSTPASARLHSDRIDMLTLLCVQKAKKGGESGFASSFAIRDIVARERPDVLKLMERGFRQSRNNEQPAGEPGITPYHVPVFAEKDGVQSCLLSGNCSIAHQRASVKDELSDVEIEALEYFMSVLERPEIRITVPLQRGEAVFMNNYEVLHSRDAFEDDEDPGKKRHLLRMWIEGRPPRPRVAEQTVVVNRSGRQGIDPQPEKVAADGSIIS
jgi:hypothetical protein